MGRQSGQGYQKAAVTLGNGDLVAAEVGCWACLAKWVPQGSGAPQGTPLDHPWNITYPALLGLAALPTKGVHAQDWGSSPSFPFSSSSSWSRCQPLSLAVSLQAWLTEIHEYAQQDVVLMLLGNKVSLPPGLCQSLLFLPHWSHGQESLARHKGTGGTCW